MRVEEHLIDLAGSPAFYRSAPTGGDPVLYLHGIPTSSGDWLPLLERAGGLAPDLIGFGASGKGGHLDYSLDSYASFVEQLLDELAIDRTALVGHDWGAAAGLAFAQRHPSRVTRLMLINAVPLLDGFRWHRLARLWRTPLLGELAMGATTRQLLARTLRKGGPFTQAEVARIWEQFDQGTQRAILRLHRASDEQSLARAGANLGELRAPSLVIWGADDPWLSSEWGEAYARRLPNSRLERVEHAGHWPWRDQPAVVDRITAFLGQP